MKTLFIFFFAFVLSLAQAEEVTSATEVPTFTQDLGNNIEDLSEKEATSGTTGVVALKNFSTYHNLALRGGLTLARGTINAEAATEDHLFTFGVNTQFGYLFEKVELNLNANILFGNVKGLRYFINDINLYAKGTSRGFFFSPMIKYITDFEPKSTWHVYLTAGPVWSMQSLKLLDFTYQNEVRRNHRINIASRGLMGGIGLQEMLPFKSMNPVYVEIIGGYLRGQYMTLVDTTNSKQVLKVAEEDTHFHVFDGIVMLNIGMTVF